jgi:hypothetical protein
VAVTAFAALALSAAPVGAATSTFTDVACGNTDPANLFTVPPGVTSVAIFATARPRDRVRLDLRPGRRRHRAALSG